MNWQEILIWGFWATASLTVVEAMGLWLGLTRMSTPILLGTIVVADRGRALLIGSAFHVATGWIFALGYAAAFEAAGGATWWGGLLLSVIHATFMLGVIIPALPAVHPRMASEKHGPSPTKALQPPGFLALNYGRRTIAVSAAAHAVYGAILGAMYTVAA